MTPEDQAAFDDAEEKAIKKGTVSGALTAIAYEAGFKAALAHRDAQASAVNEQDELQPAANWIYNALHQCEVADIQKNLMVGYNRAKRLYDAAIAAAEAHKELKC